MTPGDEIQPGAGAGGGDASAPASGPLPGLDIPSGGGGGKGSLDTERLNDISSDVRASHSAAASDCFNDRACRTDASPLRQGDGGGSNLSVADRLNDAALGPPDSATDTGSAPLHHDAQGSGSGQIRQQFDQFTDQAGQFLEDMRDGRRTTDDALKVLQDQQEKSRVYRDLGEEKPGDNADAYHVSRDEAHERSKNQAEWADRHASKEAPGQLGLIRQAFQRHVVASLNERSLQGHSGRDVPGTSSRHQLDLIGRAWDRHVKENPAEPEPDLNKPSAAPTEQFLPGAGGRRLTDGKTWTPRRETPSGRLREAWNGGRWLKEYRARLAESYRMMGARRPPMECR